MRCRTAESGIDIAIFLHDCLSNADSVCDASAVKNQFAGLWHEAVLRTGEPADFTRLIAVAATPQGTAGEDAAELAWQELQAAIELGFDGLLAEQQAAWQRTWEEVGLQLDVETPAGDASAWQQGLNYALFQVLQYAPAGRLAAARGLVNEVAGGAYAWDVDLFTIPTLALLAPEAAKAAIRQRLAMLPAARQKAEALGIDGAAFPWLADADGQETCPLWQFSLLSLHPTAAVAWALCFTVEVTGDLDLLVDGGLELLVETARFWCLRVHRPEGSAETHLRGVVGLDEYHQGVDNDYYTNAMIRWQLKATVACFRQLEGDRPEAVAALRQRLDVNDAELARFLALAASLRLPADDRQGIHLQFDGFLQLEPVQKGCAKRNPIVGRLSQPPECASFWQKTGQISRTVVPPPGLRPSRDFGRPDSSLAAATSCKRPVAAAVSGCTLFFYGHNCSGARIQGVRVQETTIWNGGLFAGLIDLTPRRGRFQA
jgi:alpha,alpha-trehalose phosphorylase